MDQYSSADEFKRAFDQLGIQPENQISLIELSHKQSKERIDLIEINEVIKTPNSKPTMGSLVYGKLERPSR